MLRLNLLQTGDVPTAKSTRIPIYAIDAYSGSAGDSQKIHRANPYSTKIANDRSPNIGKTRSGFNIAKDALQIHGQKK